MQISIALLIVLLALLIFYFNRRLQPGSAWFSSSLLVIASLLLTHHFAFSRDSIFWTAVFFNHFSPFFYLLGPFIYFYVRSTLSDRTGLSRKDLWHFIPFTVQLIGIFPYLLKPWDHKLWVAGEIINDIYNLVKLPGLVIFPVMINVIARPLSWLGYTGYSLFLVKRFQRHYPVRHRIPLADARNILRFMTAFLWLCLLTEFSFIALTIEYLVNFVDGTQELATLFWLHITSVGVAFIPVMLLFFPEILYGIPRWQSTSGTVPHNKSDVSGDQKNDESLSETYVDPESDDDASEGATPHFIDLANRINHFMDEGKPWLDPEFSLDDMARELDVPKHHLYYCYNSILKTRFTRMRSERRIGYACALLDGGATREKTIEGIGLASGFASRSSFLTTFREIKGMSPSDYMKRKKTL
jgi:AraC-like DNA-binding protein